MARFQKLIRGTSIGFALLGQPVVIIHGLAQTTRQQCDALASEYKTLQQTNSQLFLTYITVLLEDSRGYRAAGGRLRALEATAGRPDVLSDLLSIADYSAGEMRRFREQHQLPSQLDASIAAERPAEFWGGVVTELRRRMLNRQDQYMRESEANNKRLDQIDNQRKSLGCDQVSGNDGPLPIGRNPSGLPIITDDLLTRWFRAYHAMQTGGAYWRAGQMTQQDFAEVNARVAAFTAAACRPEGKAREDGAREWLCRIDPVRATLQPGFTAEELAVFQNRLTEVAAALSGNWSAVRM